MTLYTQLNVCVFVTSTDRSYTDYFNSFISLNDSLPRSYYYDGPGTCYSYYNSVGSSAVSILNCSHPYTSLFLVVGRYVTIMSYGPSTLASVMTVCEVTVTGVRQNISADGNFSLLIRNMVQYD